MKSCNLQLSIIFLIFTILSNSPSIAYSKTDDSITGFSEPVADTVTGSSIRNITPDTIRYGKETDIDITFKRNTSVTRAFLSPGGPFIADSLKKYLPPFLAINDTIIVDNTLFIATTDGDIFSLNNKNKKQASISKIQLNSPVIKLTYLQSRMFAATQSGFLYSIKIPSLIIENKIKIEGGITDIVAANNYLYLLQNKKKLLIYNTSLPSKLKLSAEHALGSHAVRIFVNNKFCFLASKENGLVVLNIENNDAIKKLGTYSTSGIVNDVVVKDNIAYVADGPIGLTLLDIKKPNNIILLGSNNKLGTISHVAVNGLRALVVNTKNKLTLLDISRSDAPSILSSFQLTNNVRKISYHKQSAVITLSNDIEIIDISAETMPPVNSEGVTLGGSRRAFIEKNIMYVADWFSGLHIYDVSDQHNIKHIANFHTKGSSKGVVVKDHYAFVGDDDHGLQIIDVSDPKNPTWVSELATTGLAYTMKIVGSVLYLADHRGGFHIIDISDIKHPKRLGGIDTPGKAWAIDVYKNIAYVADDLSGLLIFDVSSQSNPQLIANFNPGGFAEDVKIRGDKAFVTFFDSGLFILDIKTPNNPKLISHLSIPGNARGIELDYNIAYISAWYAGVQIVDITNTESPKIIGYYDTDGATWGTAKNNEHLFALDWWGGIKAINVEYSHSPILTSRYHAKDTIRDLSTKGNYTYTTNGKSGLQVFDTKNTLNPMWVTALELPGEVDAISINDVYAYIVSNNKIYVVSIKNPFNPKLINTLNVTNNITSFATNNNFAYALSEKGRLIVYNISIANNPKVISSQQIGASTIWINDNKLVASKKKKGLDIYFIEKNGLIKLTDTYATNTNIDSLSIFNESIFIYSKQENRIATLSMNRNHYKEVASTKLDEIIYDMKVSGSILYATSKHSGLIAFTINNDEQLLFKNTYSTANDIKKFQINNSRAFFAGDKLLSTLTLLPDMTSIISSSTTLSINIPKNMPLGIYNLLLVNNNNTIHNITNIISVKLPNFQKPQFKK